MKTFFKNLLVLFLVLGMVIQVFLTMVLVVFNAEGFVREGYSTIFFAGDFEYVWIPNGRDIPLSERFCSFRNGCNHTRYYAGEHSVDIERTIMHSNNNVFAIGSENYKYEAVPISANGSFIVLNQTMLTVLVVVGWIFYVAIIATYFKDIIGGIKSFVVKTKQIFSRKK